MFTYPKFKATDGNGNPLRGGKLYSYAAGTTTAKDTYSDAALTTANTNPITLDSNGEATVYLSGTYKFNLKTSDLAQVPGWPIDNIDEIYAMEKITISKNTASPPAVIGLPADSDLLHLVGKDAADSGILIDAFGTSINPRIYFRRSRGTNAAKTGIKTGDNIGIIEIQGHDGTTYTADYDGLISFQAAEDWSVGAHGTKIRIEVTPDGTLIPQTSCYLTYRGIEPYVSGNSALGAFIRNVSTGVTAYSSIYFGDVDSETSAIIGIPCKNNTAYGGAKSLFLGTNTAVPVVFITGGTEKVRVSSDSNGFKFPNTAVPSTDANTLDDYEEFTFNPTMTFGTPGDLSVAYTTQVGTYTKIGNRVFYDIYLICIPTFTTSAGGLIIGGLPFTVENTANHYAFVAVGQFQNINLSGYQIGAYPNINTKTIGVVGSALNGGAVVTVGVTHIASASQLVFCVSGNYKTLE